MIVVIWTFSGFSPQAGGCHVFVKAVTLIFILTSIYCVVFT